MSLPTPLHSRRAISLHRWYDQDLRLSETVALLEELREESQILFAYLLLYICEESTRRKGRLFFRELTWTKLLGIYKARHGRRWYDREPLLQKAFNTLYALGEQEQMIIAENLYAPVRLTHYYEASCAERDLPISMDRIQEILAFCFKEGSGKALEVYSILLT